MSSPPSVLFHYTTQAGLLGILATDSIWATKIHYLNDSSEYLLALDLAANLLKTLLTGEHSKTKKRKIQCLLDNLKTIARMNVCVCSFSAKQDLLSQWRAYSGQPGGYSVGFNTNLIQKEGQTQGFLLAECIYDANEQKRLVEELVTNSLAIDFNIAPSRIDPKRPRTMIALATGGSFAMDIAKLAPIIKSNAFFEEQEWRLISTAGISVDNMSFRPGQSMLTPYVPVQLDITKSNCLTSVTVGPTPHTELAKLATQNLLARRSLSQSVEVSSSAAPYRGW